MSREAYTPNLTAAGSSQTTNNQATTSGGGFNLSQNVAEDPSRAVQYLCGDCDARVNLKRGEAIRCKECGYRVLYKERTNR